MIVLELLKILFVVVLIFTIVPVLVYLERKISAWIQWRVGPNRVGPFGLLQPLADGIKFIFKEDLIPANADKFLFVLAPVLVFLPPSIALALIPFGNQIALDYQIGTWHLKGTLSLQVANLNIGILFVMSVLSLGVYGVALAGWSSNNKYALLGGLRASAQMIAYEISLGLSIIAVIMTANTVNMQQIVLLQSDHLLHWNVFYQPIAFVIFMVAAFAENNRLPFDMPECEAELVAGYHTEYSSMKFALFFLGEYVAMLVMSCLIVTLFLGGWSLPGVIDPTDLSIKNGILSFMVFAAKTGVILFFYIWVRWTLPRFKWQQIMHLGWKTLIPISLLNLVLTAVIIIAKPYLLS
ncbi:MAG: NADH-quinone oxidoreductase subunit NuoH [Planctomycetota bacterium]